MVDDFDPASLEVERLLQEDGRRPLGGARRVSGRLNQELSTASSAAADNLLLKAVRRIEGGHPEQARAFVDRALGLPVDVFEGMRPAVWSAHMFLFEAIADDHEDSVEGDHGWLDRAEKLIGRSGPAAAQEVRGCLVSMLDGYYDLDRAEIRRIRALTPGLPVDYDPMSDIPDDDETRAEAILEVLWAVVEFETRLREQSP